MKITKTNLITEAVFSEDRTKRYLLHKTWDETKPSLCIILLAPSDGIVNKSAVEKYPKSHATNSPVSPVRICAGGSPCGLKLFTRMVL